MHELKTLLEQAGELPSLPEIYIRVTELLEDEGSDAYEIGEALQTDPSLTAKILKLINSAYYGLTVQVTSIAQAVSLLGRQHLQQILMGSVLVGAFEDIDIPDFPIRDFWQHSIKTAIIARHLAMQNARIIDHEAIFTAGLLHDIGWMVIAKAEPGSFVDIAGTAQAEGKDIIQVETDKLGVTHVDVGVALLEKWDIPGFIIYCISKHHDSDCEGPFAIDAGIIFLANQLSRHALDNDEEAMDAILAEIPNWQKTGCTLEQVAIACRLADEQWLEVMESLGMVDLYNSDDPDDPFEFRTRFDRND